MSILALYRRFLSFLFIILISFALFGLFTFNVVGTTQRVVQTNGQTKSPVVLFYQANGQLLNSSNMHGAINLLRANGFHVLISNNTLNATSLTGVNVLIIPNPGAGFSFTQSDLTYINIFMSSPNHGLFLLSNPMSTNTTFAGTPLIMNALIIDLPAVFQNSQFQSANDGNGYVLQHFDPINSTYTNILNVPLQNSSFLTFPAHTSIVTESNAITANKTFAQAGTNTYGVDSTGSYSLQASSNIILGGDEDTNTSNRLALSGSTLMFSDFPGPNNDNNSWFNSANNSYVWLSMVQWLANTGNSPNTGVASNTGLLSIVDAVIGIIIVVIGILFFFTGSDPNLSLTKQSPPISTKKGSQRREESAGTKILPDTSVKSSHQVISEPDQDKTPPVTSSKKVKVRKS